MGTDNAKHWMAGERIGLDNAEECIGMHRKALDWIKQRIAPEGRGVGRDWVVQGIAEERIGVGVDWIEHWTVTDSMGQDTDWTGYRKGFETSG